MLIDTRHVPCKGAVSIWVRYYRLEGNITSCWFGGVLREYKPPNLLVLIQSRYTLSLLLRPQSVAGLFIDSINRVVRCGESLVLAHPGYQVFLLDFRIVKECFASITIVCSCPDCLDLFSDVFFQNVSTRQLLVIRIQQPIMSPLPEFLNSLVGVMSVYF